MPFTRSVSIRAVKSSVRPENGPNCPTGIMAGGGTHTPLRSGFKTGQQRGHLCKRGKRDRFHAPQQRRSPRILADKLGLAVEVNTVR